MYTFKNFHFLSPLRTSRYPPFPPAFPPSIPPCLPPPLATKQPDHVTYPRVYRALAPSYLGLPGRRDAAVWIAASPIDVTSVTSRGAAPADRCDARRRCSGERAKIPTVTVVPSTHRGCTVSSVVETGSETTEIVWGGLTVEGAVTVRFLGIVCGSCKEEKEP